MAKGKEGMAEEVEMVMTEFCTVELKSEQEPFGIMSGTFEENSELILDCIVVANFGYDLGEMLETGKHQAPLS